MKLPSHTTRYFAEQTYRAAMTTGKFHIRTFTTVQGIKINVSLNMLHREAQVRDADTGRLIKIEPFRKNWL